MRWRSSQQSQHCVRCGPRPQTARAKLVNLQLPTPLSIFYLPLTGASSCFRPAFQEWSRERRIRSDLGVLSVADTWNPSDDERKAARQLCPQGLPIGMRGPDEYEGGNLTSPSKVETPNRASDDRGTISPPSAADPAAAPHLDHSSRRWCGRPARPSPWDATARPTQDPRRSHAHRINHSSDLERRFDRLTTQKNQECPEALLGAQGPRRGQGLSGVHLRGRLDPYGLAAGWRPGHRAEFS